MKNRIKKAAAAVLLLVLTCCVAHHCNTIAVRTEYAQALKASGAGVSNNDTVHAQGSVESGFSDSRETLDALVGKSGMEQNTEFLAKLQTLFTDFFGLMKDVWNGSAPIYSETFSERFIGIFNGLFLLDRQVVAENPQADGLLQNDGFVANAASVLWKYMDYYDTRRLSAQTMASGVSVLSDIPYLDDGDPYHLLDIYMPEGNTEKLPVIIDIHGGGLMYGTKELNRIYSSVLAQKGYIVICINYRLCPEVLYPAQVQDVMSAYSWVAQNGAAYNCDLNNVYVVGDSGGGQLAFYTALVNTSEQLKQLYQVTDTGLSINAVGLISGMFDMKNGINSVLLSCFLGYDYRNTPYYPYLQPEEIIDLGTLPPAYIVTSFKDFLRPASMDMAELLEKKGIEHQFHDWELTFNESSGHITSVAYPELPESVKTIEEMLAFFQANRKE